MFDFSLEHALSKLSVVCIPALLGIILHEVAHGYAALRCGDPTAKFAGRLTLNPIPHIDPIGLLMFVVTSLSNSFVFGWAKPVPVDTRYFTNGRRDLAFVALAGPLANVLLAIFFAVVLKLLLSVMSVQLYQTTMMAFILEVLQYGIIINIGLALFNLLPIAPLDGSKILAYFMPPHIAYRYLSIGRYGFIILLVLILTGVLGIILNPLFRFTLQLVVDFLKF